MGGGASALEELDVKRAGADELRGAYEGRRVFLTGHTGFKGGWLALWLRELGARVYGYALPPPTTPSLFDAAGLSSACEVSEVADVRDLARLEASLRAAEPDVVLHLAAQPLVRVSYEQPLDTFTTNALGTAHLLEAVRRLRRPCAVVLVTSDKCYENREWVYGYREDEALGGHDVYSMSKGAAELVAAGWRRSFFDPARLSEHGVAVATARAGNVIGGGDWAKDRIVPDCIAALADGRPVVVRRPRAVRPWQHVLEPLGGYLALGARLLGVGTGERARFCEAWNFGPAVEDSRTVEELVEQLVEAWGSGTWEDRQEPNAPHEAGLLRLSIEKAQARLGWWPRWHFEEACRRTVEWYRAWARGAGPRELRELSLRQLRDYTESR